MEMDLTTRIIAIVVLILFSGYFSMAEISLAASPKVKLHQALDAGDKRAQKVLDLQVKPGPFCGDTLIGNKKQSKPGTGVLENLKEYHLTEECADND